MKRHLMLGLGAALAGLLALVAARSGRPPNVAANIGVAKDGAGAGAPDAAAVQAAPGTSMVIETPAIRLVGDAHMRDAIDLSRARLIDDAFYISLGDGTRAVLTLDHVLQEAAEKALDRAKAPLAAIVVMSVDGRVLALAGRRGSKSAPELATRVWAPAASVFKIVTAAALVDAGVQPDAKVCYHGGVRSVSEQNLTDSPRDRLCNDLGYALATSQNAIVAKLVHQHLQPAALRAMAGAFGVGAAPSFALAMEPGRADIPDGGLEFARVAAGFWETEISPMGGAVLTATVASGGQAVTPQIVSHIARGGDLRELEPVPPRRVLTEKVADAVARMMVGTTEYGTARKGFHDGKGRPFIPDVAIAGKTGTLSRQAPEGHLQYSWFVGFAPADDPELVISVLIGNSELWHLKAHTAARMVLQAAF